MPYWARVEDKARRVTTNVGKIFTRCIGEPLPTLDGKTGREVYDIVWPAVATIFHPEMKDILINLQPANGFGNLGDARRFLVDVMEMASDHPEEIMEFEEI